MNELFLDYTIRKRMPIRRKRLLFAIGAILLLGGITLLIYQFIEPLGLSFSISATANLLLGISFILQAMEPKFMYPEKYLRITPEAIEYNLGSFSKLQKIEWKVVDEITISKKSIDLICGKYRHRLKMIHFPISDEKRIKARIQIILDEKS